MHRVVEILKKRKEAEDFYSLFFKDRRCERAIPGQFLMVWVPGVDEIPMSISRIGEISSISVLVIGEATSSLASKENGDKIGIRGPYGRGFSLEGFSEVAVVGGGSGMAPLLAASKKAKELGARVYCFQGARRKGKLAFLKELEEVCDKLYLATDDGSFGYKGNVVELFKEKFEEVNPEVVLACGPEKMLYSLALLCEDLGVEAQISLERIMKCGVGLCGTCSIGGMLVCKEGPVFRAKDLLRIEEFGKKKRGEDGRLVEL